MNPTRLHHVGLPPIITKDYWDHMDMRLADLVPTEALNGEVLAIEIIYRPVDHTVDHYTPEAQ